MATREIVKVVGGFVATGALVLSAVLAWSLFQLNKMIMSGARNKRKPYRL
ncbi:MAG: hypothetical protein JWQ49_231 [Edaphobacter sp.]|nr:hypothetical protein [Edaphobacter sp.]